MGTRMISLSIRPNEVLELLISEVDGDLLHSEYHHLKKDVGFGSVVFQRYMDRVDHPISLIVNAENIHGITHATIISSSFAEGWDQMFDGDVGDELMDKVMEILERYIIAEKGE